MRILVVEDDPSALAMLKDMLTRLGHSIVAETESPAQALQSYKKSKPDVVTLDLGLGKDGVDAGLSLLKDIRSLDPNAKVFVITGHAQKGVQEAAMAAGAYRYISKPFSMDDLKLIVIRAKFV